MSGAGARRRWLVLAACAGLVALAWAGLSRVYVNASWSDGAWGYLILPLGKPELGDAVLFAPPAALGAPVPYLKTVRGLPGAQVTVDVDRMVAVDGVVLGRAKEAARDGRPLEAVAAGVAPAARYYLHADHADSHDSRYAEVGFVPRERILGRAVPLPNLPWLGLEGPLVTAEDFPEGASAEIGMSDAASSSAARSGAERDGGESGGPEARP